MVNVTSMLNTLEEIVAHVRQANAVGKRVLPCGNGTKPNLSSAPDIDTQRLSLSSWSGVVEYQPFEFTITAKSGTRIDDIQRELESQGQFLPFDPLLPVKGATLGGTVATGVSGPGRLLFGGIRDFVLGVQFVDGLGHVVRGGGKVVKNAAGFDLPKMMVGSLGRLGIMTEITLKVFPSPVGYRTLKIPATSLSSALQHISSLMLLPIDVVAVELDSERNIFVRVAGDETTTKNLSARIRDYLAVSKCEEWLGDLDAKWWKAVCELEWTNNAPYLIRVPLSLTDIERFDRALDRLGILRRYSAAANAAWIACFTPEQYTALEGLLLDTKLKGLVLRGSGPLIVGLDTTAAFTKRIQAAIDPEHVFAAF